ncbi:cleavage polyadenylation factor subunit fip1 [Coemansia aciculifera]|uniref:Cleavage polyadenylation factor subunit fip1 n=1 Tax=Coemansia aciculifera TaxID=417176 RepID=A0ACC1MAM4_9FUNG|nr:cleavage polyadenylation factor subunit fip1 [Coemansia aciculifera]
MDDEDAFLYGDLNAETPTAKDVPMGEEGNEIETDVYDDVLGDGQLNSKLNEGNSEGENGDSVDDRNSEESSSDEDDDLLVILEPGAANANTLDKGADAAGGGQGESGSGGAIVGTADASKGKGPDAGMQALLSGDVDMIDLLTVQLLNGIDMFKIDLDMLDEKPWRMPGADVTDYFNFGFNEETWKLYCLKQRQIRAEFNARNMLPPAMMMMPGAGGMPMANPAMMQAMMSQGFRPEMAGNMYPPYMQQGQHGISPMGGKQPGDNQEGDDGSDDDQGDSAGQHRLANMAPNSQAMQQMQFQQQQMRMGMQQGYYPGANFAQGMGGPQRNMPMNQQQMNMQMGNLPPQMQMQLQMQMGGRPPVAPNSQGMQPRPGPGPANAMQRGLSSHRPSSSLSQTHDQRDSDKGGESGRASRPHEGYDKADGQHRHRERDDARPSSRSHHGRDREKDSRGHEKERGREKERGHSERDKSVTDVRRSGRRQGTSRESSSRSKAPGRESSGRDKDGRTHESSSARGGERSDRQAHKRRRSSSREKDLKSETKRRH